MRAVNSISTHSRHEFNSGGPRSRTRNQRIQSTLLGESGDRVGFPSILSAALSFEAFDPLETVYNLLESAGIKDPEELRARYALPDEPCICHPSKKLKPLRVSTAEPDDVLQQVALLGLCTANHYDPQRPVLLTRASLKRRMVLYSGRGYYA
jgi:hypothetical protein